MERKKKTRGTRKKEKKVQIEMKFARRRKLKTQQSSWMDTPWIMKGTYRLSPHNPQAQRGDSEV